MTASMISKATAVDRRQFLKVTGGFLLVVGGGEMGQGIYTRLAMGAAEELMVKWEKVKVEPLTAIFLVALGRQRRHSLAASHFPQSRCGCARNAHRRGGADMGRESHSLPGDRRHDQKHRDE